MTKPQQVEQVIEEAMRAKTPEEAKRIAHGRLGLCAVSLISFVESLLPIPLITDPFLVAAIMVNRANTLKLIVFTTLSSVLGGLVAFAFVFFFLELVLQWMTPDMLVEYERLSGAGSVNSFLLTLLGAITPIPYTIVVIVVAALQGSILAFLLASVLGRGFRYVVVGYCAYRFGPLAMPYIKRYIGWFSLLLVVAVGLLLWWKL